MTAFSVSFVGIGEGEVTRRSFAAVVPANYFATLNGDLMAGRTFTAEEERPGSQAASAIVSHRYWKSHGSDPALIGDDDQGQRQAVHGGGHHQARLHRARR